MAGTKGNQTSFKKGDPRINRKGAPRITEEQKALRKSLPKEFIRIINENVSLSKEELRDKYLAKDTPVLTCIICKALERGVATGDINKFLEPILIRILGKPKDIVVHEGTTKTNVNIHFIDSKENDK